MRNFLAFLFALLIAAPAFAGPINAYPVAGTLTGTEGMIGTQGGITVQITAAQLKTFTLSAPVIVGGLTVDSPTGGNKGAGTINAASGYYINGIRPSFSAASYGVDPTGTVDSTSAFTRALSAASGAELDIPCGTYLVSTLAPPVNTVVKGCSTGQTTIKRLSVTTSTSGVPLVVVASGDDIENISVDLNSPALGNWISGIGPQGSTTNAVLRHISVINPGFNGLDWDDNSHAWTHAGLIIEDVTVSNSGWEGAVFRGIANGYIADVTVTSSGYNAIDIENDSHSQFVDFRSDKSSAPPVIYTGAGNPAATASTTSLTIGTGSFSPTVGTGLPYGVGQWFCVFETASPANFICGPITAYNSGTGALTFTEATNGGSGTHTDWTGVTETGFLLFRGVLNSNIVIAHPVVNDNRHAASDGIGVGENGTTSSTSLTPGTGTKTFTLPAGGCADFPLVGQEVSIFSSGGGPTTDWMRGTVTSCSGTTLVTSISNAAGTGAHTDWVLDTEPGPVLISDAVVTHAGLFGIDLNSNTTLIGAYIDQPANRGLEQGLDLGGRLSGIVASGVTIRDVLNTNSTGAVGVYFGDGLGFQSFEGSNYSHITVFDDQATKTTVYGVEVNGTAAQQFYAPNAVNLDNSNSYYSQVLTAPYAVFGTLDPRLGGAWATLTSTAQLVWTGGTPSAPTISLSWDDHGSGKTRAFSVLIYTGSALNGATALSVALPFTADAAVGCTVDGLDATVGAPVFGNIASGSASMSIILYGQSLTAAHFMRLSGTCQSQ